MTHSSIRTAALAIIFGALALTQALAGAFLPALH